MNLDVGKEEISLLMWGINDLKEIYDKKLEEDPDDRIYKGIYEELANLLTKLRSKK